MTALLSEGRTVEIGLEAEDSILGTVYIGKVKRIVRNLNAAFVDFAEGRTGYYSLTDNPRPLFADSHEGAMKEGDEVIVQVEKDAVRTKDPVLTSNISLQGRYAVVTAGKRVVGFSGKIHDREFKERLKPQIEALIGEDAGVIVRTNAYGMEEALLAEIRLLMDQYRELLKRAAYRTCYSVLRRAEPEYIKTLKGCPAGTLEEVVTDLPEVYDQVEAYLKSQEPDGVVQKPDIKKQESVCQASLRLYRDPLVSLARLYSLNAVMDQALQKKVWLKSGGYLVIDITEAMVVIDVNTGKYAGKKKLEETVRLTNQEAAGEICRQLRLRNLSGIILVDFIDMHTREDQEQLLDTLRRHAAQDTVPTTVVDMTALGLVEMTRKKQKRPLWEQLAEHA